MGRKMSPEKEKLLREENKWAQAIEKMNFCPEPSYQFEIGDSVDIGALSNIFIKNKFFEGKLYLIEYDREEQDSYGKKTGNIVKDTEYYPWYNIRPKNNNEESLIQNKDFNLNFFSTSISDILTKKYFFGIDMDPDYQRGYVWEQKDKENLIDSIFCNIDIGKFCFVHREYKSRKEPLYEVLDGKQRISTICEYYENRFPYKGKYFNDLNWKDKHHFTSYNIAMAEVYSEDKETILKYFLMLNISGKQIDEEHLNKIRKMIIEENKEN